MTKTRTKRVLLVGLVVVVLAAVVAVYVVLQNPKPKVTATFPDTTGVTLGFQIKSHGAPVGTVSTVRVVNGQAELGFDLDKSVYPIHQDATAWIRPVNLLGEKYIEFNPGTPGSPLMAEPYHIDPAHTRTSTTLQDVLDTLDNPTSTSLATVVDALGEGVQDSGPQAADAIKALAPAMTDTSRLTGILNQQNAILNGLIDHVSPVAKAVGADGSKPLDHLVTTTNQTLQTVNANRQNIDATLDELPGTLSAARRTLDQLAGTANAATPTLAAVRPTTDHLTDIAHEVQDLAKVADPAVTSLRPVVDRADQLLDQAAPAVAQLRPVGAELVPTARLLQPVGQQLLDTHLRDLLDFVRLWSLSTNGRDGISNYFRGVVHFTPQALGELAGDLPVPGAPAAGKALYGTQLPGAAALTNGATGLAQAGAGALLPGATHPNAPASPPSATGSSAPATGASAPAASSDPTNATGLSPGQEQSMLGQMIGGR